MGKIKNKARLHAKAVKLKCASKTTADDTMEIDRASVTGLDKVPHLVGDKRHTLGDVLLPIIQKLWGMTHLKNPKCRFRFT